EGPLTFLVDSNPPTIRLEKDIVIYPVEGPEPAVGREPPLPGPTRFLCQLLVIEIDSEASPPSPSRAVASWEGGRAHTRGKVMEGDVLEWVLPPKPEGAPGKAVAVPAPGQPGKPGAPQR